MTPVAVGKFRALARTSAVKAAAGLSTFVVSGLLLAGLANSLAAEVACTPDAGLSQCTSFTFSGADQSFIVPEGVTALEVGMWGAGGGGSPFGSTGLGGGGGYAGGSLAVTPGATLTIVVGEGGKPRTIIPTYGGGGAGGNDSSAGNFDGGSGGGRSALRDAGTELVTAAGGGGAAGATATNGGTANAVSFAGAGGQDAAYNTGCRPGAAATAGTLVAGGIGGVGSRPGENGSSLQGGTGGLTTASNTGAGGGGGGGYFGGGGGAGQFVSANCSGISAARGQEGGGAGGSSYLSPLVTGGSTIAGNRQSAANTGDNQYVAGTAVGGSLNVPGGDGLVVIQWSDPVASLTIDKTGTLNDLNANSLIDLGETISYSFLVTNTGTVTLAGVTVDDSMLSAAGIAVAPGPQTLAPGGSVTFTATYTPSQADIDFGSVVNTATATGTRASGALVRSSPDTETAPPAPPRLALAKSGAFDDIDGNGSASVGDTLVYSFTVTNTGARTLTGVIPVDAGPTFNGVAGESVLSAMAPTAVTLSPGAAQTFTATYIMTQGDADRGAGIADGINNTARASGQSSTATILSNNAAVALTLPAPRAADIVVVKQALRRQVRFGETVPYVIRVTITPVLWSAEPC